MKINRHNCDHFVVQLDISFHIIIYIKKLSYYIDDNGFLADIY